MHALIVPQQESRSLLYILKIKCSLENVPLKEQFDSFFISFLVQILGDTTKKMMRSCRFSDTSHVFTLMAICFITLFSSSVLVEGKIRRFKWEVKYELKSPDCFEKLVITINGQFPGPTIKAQQGDTIIVDLKNSFMTENVAVHWHGIRQVRTQILKFL